LQDKSALLMMGGVGITPFNNMPDPYDKENRLIVLSEDPK